MESITPFRGFIYLIHNTISNKVYIGQTVKKYACDRWSNHAHRLRKGTHASPHLQASWNKYGKDAFEFCVLEEHASFEALNEAEQFYIEYFRSLGIELYNTKQGGLNGRHSEESIAKRRGRHYPVISEMLRSRPPTERQRQSPIKAQLAKGITYQIVDPDGQLHSFRLLNEFCREHDLQASCLCLVLQGKQLHHKGWTAYCGDAEKQHEITARAQSPRFEAISPRGEHYYPENFKAFCLENNLSPSHMCNVVQGKRTHHKGWHARRIE